MNITICISSFGDDYWSKLAHHRALPSTENQDAEVVLYHDPDGTVGSSRNGAAEQATGDWLCFLDADDQLSPGYCWAMRRAWQNQGAEGPLVLLTPSVSYIQKRRTRPPRIWPEVPISKGNWLVIGTLVPTSLFWEAGGFKDYGDPPGSNAYEDWSLWARCIMLGAEVWKVKRAVYIAHWEGTSRHRGADLKTRMLWHWQIGSDLWPDKYPPEWLQQKTPRERRARR